MRNVFSVLLLLLSLTVAAQEKKDDQKIKVSPFTAQFLVSTDLKAVYVNIAGTGIRYTKNKTIISITIFPSLSFREDKPLPGESKKPFVRPGFALGPLFQYKRAMIGFPAFYQDDAWHLTVGLGMKIGR